MCTCSAATLVVGANVSTLTPVLCGCVLVIRYNLGAISFTPAQQAESIKKLIPEFSIGYNVDERQKIAETWPRSLDDSHARRDWGWEPDFDLDKMSAAMIRRLRKKGVGNPETDRTMRPSVSAHQKSAN